MFFWVATTFVALAAAGGFYYVALDGQRSQVIYAPVLLTFCVVAALITYFRERRKSRVRAH